AGLALVTHHGHGHGPSLAGPADHVGGRDAGPVEVHLPEFPGDTVDHAQGPLLDARLAHGHGERGQPAVPGDVRIGASEQHAPLRGVRVAGPDLVAVDHVLVSRQLRAGRERPQIGPGLWLAESLAPAVAAVDDARQEPRLHVVAAVTEDALDEVADAGPGRRARAGQLLVDDHVVHARQLLPADLDRPRQP